MGRTLIEPVLAGRPGFMGKVRYEAGTEVSDEVAATIRNPNVFDQNDGWVAPVAEPEQVVDPNAGQGQVDPNAQGGQAPAADPYDATNDELKALIDARNADGRDAEKHLSKSGNKSELQQALRDDDEAKATAEAEAAAAQQSGNPDDQQGQPQGDGTGGNPTA
jgi:hypothetical protein